MVRFCHSIVIYMMVFIDYENHCDKSNARSIIIFVSPKLPDPWCPILLDDVQANFRSVDVPHGLDLLHGVPQGVDVAEEGSGGGEVWSQTRGGWL